MKKIISLALALGLFVGATAQNAAASVTASGYFMITGDALNNADLADKDTVTTLKFKERVQIALDMDMGDDVTGQLSFRVPYGQQFGDAISGVEELAPQLRTAYINFPIAMLDVTAGLQAYALPSYFGSGVNPILDDNLPGFVVGADFGMIAPELAWFITEYDTTKRNVYALSLPVALADGMTLTPWATMIDNTGSPSDTYMGATFDANMGNIFAGAGVVYGMSDADDVSALVAEAHFAIDLGSLTPGVAAWYGMSGDAGPPASDTWGSWLAFNGAGDYAFGNQNGLQNGFGGLDDWFSTLGVALTVADIQLSEAMDLNARLIYLMNTAEGSEDSDLEIGVALNTALTSNLNIVVDAAYYMPMVEGSGNAASVACTFVANF